MAAPRYDDVRDEPLTTDDSVLERACLLLGHAIRRQVWLMFLDEDDCQLPVIIPSYVPRRPGREHRENYPGMLGVLFEEVDASAMVIAYERRGDDELTDPDRQWLDLLYDACAISDVPLRGPLLVHDGGVRWVAAEDIPSAHDALMR